MPRGSYATGYFPGRSNLGDPDALRDVARNAGVDDQGMRQALADGHYAELIDRITAAARKDEVISTPTFIFSGGFRLMGAQDYNVFESITSRLLAKRARGEV